MKWQALALPCLVAATLAGCGGRPNTNAESGAVPGTPADSAAVPSPATPAPLDTTVPSSTPSSIPMDSGATHTDTSMSK